MKPGDIELAGCDPDRIRTYRLSLDRAWDTYERTRARLDLLLFARRIGAEVYHLELKAANAAYDRERAKLLWTLTEGL